MEKAEPQITETVAVKTASMLPRQVKMRAIAAISPSVTKIGDFRSPLASINVPWAVAIAFMGIENMIAAAAMRPVSNLPLSKKRKDRATVAKIAATTNPTTVILSKN